MPAVAAIGALLERLVLQKNDPPVITIASLTRAGSTATLTTEEPHGFATGDYVTIAGAVPTGYNARVKVTVTGARTFTVAASALLSTPATGAMTALYTSDGQAGRAIGWTTVDTVPAEMVPIPTRNMESIQAKAMASQNTFQFRVRVRTDITPKMRALWTPRWPVGAATKTLEIHGVLPFEDGRRWMHLFCGALS